MQLSFSVLVHLGLCGALGKADHSLLCDVLCVLLWFPQHHVLVLSVPAWLCFSPTWAPLPVASLKSLLQAGLRGN